MKFPLRKPPTLKKGDMVGFAAPAGGLRDEHLALLESGVAIIKKMGLRPRIDPEIYYKHLYMAGKDQERANHLTALFSDQEVKGIFSLRGGYGSLRILSLLDPKLIRKNPKVFVGSSDITTLHLFFLEMCGIVTFYGPNVASHQFSQGEKSATMQAFQSALIKREPLGEVRCKVLRSGFGKGPLIGGCLSNFVTALGTPFQPKTEGCVLFLEDIREAPYRIDRMLNHLSAAGIFEGLQGILFGEFIDCDLEDRGSDIIWEVIDDALADFSFPVLYDFPAGHGKDCLTLPLGLDAALDGDGGKALFLETPTDLS
jgi:muramoyltetrapeptide carboxypeptidase